MIKTQVILNQTFLIFTRSCVKGAPREVRAYIFEKFPFPPSTPDPERAMAFANFDVFHYGSLSWGPQPPEDITKLLLERDALEIRYYVMFERIKLWLRVGDYGIWIFIKLNSRLAFVACESGKWWALCLHRYLFSVLIKIID